jgi:hypothetical protein
MLLIYDSFRKSRLIIVKIFLKGQTKFQKYLTTVNAFVLLRAPLRLLCAPCEKWCSNQKNART